ncbi:uncharacterized protein EV420DRAFT_1650541 [Desarmillaria tabescens]|uniref:Uncharacterized protein n=1 Tax=Armillaria tabescens TaxID=1929756 RepID=A0AA39JEP8_ARMTA|nr:uncharacterized protein EV420DRAFT_1650541 [Desarmillaria tabescens]KAK0440411.1 hypothetical protein EV420DRAFT_1650541 [Desarmillaria tabescens]
MGLVTSNPLRRLKRNPGAAKGNFQRPVLPQELIDCILDQLYDDHRTLIVCLHVGRPFLARARAHIFSSVHIQLEPRRNTWKRFLSLFSSSQHLAPLVRAIHLRRNHQWPTECRFMSAKAVVRVLNSLVNLEEVKLQEYGPKIFRKKEGMEASLFNHLFADNRIKRVHLHDCKFFRKGDLFSFLRGFPEMENLWIDKGLKCPVSASAFSNDLPGESGTIYLKTLRVLSDWKNPLGVLAHPKSPLSFKEVKSLAIGTDSCVQHDGAVNVARLADGFQKLVLLNIGVYEALVTHDIKLNPFPIHQLRFLAFGLNTDKMELAPLLENWISLLNTIHSECALRKVTIAIFGFSYFIINEPQASAKWPNDAANVVTWEKGVLDDITHFDIELMRLSQDGVTYVAYNVEAYPTSPKSLNIYLKDIPAGDDYFLLFLNSTHGIMHCLSSRFSIVNATDVTSSATAPATLDTSIPTVTISGSPDPTKGFVTTFASKASSIVFGITSGHKCGGAMVLAGIMVGAALALW